MDTGHVAATPIAAEKDWSARESGFKGDEEIETIDPKFVSRESDGGNLALQAALALRGRTRAAGRGDSLTLRQSIPVAHQCESGTDGVISIQEPAEIVDRATQRRPVMRSERFGIFWMRTPVLTRVGHVATMSNSPVLPNGVRA